jgi:hypothetical protein
MQERLEEFINKLKERLTAEWGDTIIVTKIQARGYGPTMNVIQIKNKGLAETYGVWETRTTGGGSLVQWCYFT